MSINQERTVWFTFSRAMVFLIFNALYLSFFYPLILNLTLDMYYQRASPFFNNLMEWRDMFDLDFYIAEVDRLHIKTLTLSNLLLWMIYVGNPAHLFNKIYFFLKEKCERHSYLYKAVSVVCALVIIAVTVYCTLKYYIRIPMADSLFNIDLIDKWYQGKLTWPDIWTWHPGGQHRNVLPQLINIAVAARLHWNFIYIVCMTLFFAFLCYAIIIYKLFSLRKIIGDYHIWLLIPVITLFAFSLRMEKSWIWDQGLYYYCCLLPAYAGLALLCGKNISNSRIVAAWILGFISMTSFSAGAVYWFAALFILWSRLNETDSVTKRRLIAWSVAAVFALTVFAVDYTTYAHIKSPFDFWKHLPDFFCGIFIFLGNLAENSPFAFLVGLIGLLLYLMMVLEYLKLKEKKLGVLFFLSLGVFSILCAVLVSMARSFKSALHMLDFNYVCFSYMFWVSNFTVFTYLICQKCDLRFKRFWQWLTHNKWLIALFIIYVAYTSRTSLISIQWFHQRYSETEEAFLKWNMTNQKKLRYIHYSLRKLYEWRDVLKRNELNVFYEAKKKALL